MVYGDIRGEIITYWQGTKHTHTYAYWDIGLSLDAKRGRLLDIYAEVYAAL